jgi:tRNA pseudouridine38-40 synthase
MKIKLLIEYDGTKYSGWQKQKTQPSIQETIEIAIKTIFANLCEITLHGAGRTDAGVHALGQVAHFEISDQAIINKWKHNLKKLPLAINANMLDSGICILAAEEVSDSFHARFAAIMRHYQYLILNRSADSPLYNKRVWNIHSKLDEKIMNTAAQFLIGHHNFNAFRSSQFSASNPHRTISDIKVYRKDDIITIEVSAKSFLHNQVRIIVGTLKEIGLGKKEPEYVKLLLQNRERIHAGPTAPPYGLYFTKVEY